MLGPAWEVDHETYERLVDELVEFLDGDTDTVVHRLRGRDAVGGVELEYEQAAACATGCPACARRSSASRWWPTATRTSTSSASPRTISRRPSRCSSSAKAGSSAGRGSCSTRSRTWPPGELVGDVLEGLYDDPPLGVPKSVLVPADPDDPELYADWLSHLRGSRVDVRVPKRRAKRELQATVTRNASEEFRATACAGPAATTPGRALNELQGALGLPEPRSASSATTRRATSRAATTSARWW